MIRRLRSFVGVSPGTRTDRQPPRRLRALLVLVTTLTLPHGDASAQAKHYPLDSTAGLRLVNVTAEPATLEGKKGLRATISEEARARFQRMTRDAQGRLAMTDRSLIPNPLVVIDGLAFANGVIEAEIAGAPAPGASESARGFVGIAFRLQNDPRTFDQFYLRPTNGRAEDQERRNHTVQYSSHPDWPFDRLRKEAPSKYEAYVDLVPGVWTKVRIEVRGAHARLYVHDQKQPTLIVNDLKLGAQAKGGVALSLDVETIAHFRNLTITPANYPLSAESTSGGGANRHARWGSAPVKGGVAHRVVSRRLSVGCAAQRLRPCPRFKCTRR